MSTLKLKTLLYTILSASSALAQQPYLISTFAGGGLQNGVSGSSFALGRPSFLAIDGSGNLYIPDWNAIYRLSPGGTMVLMAGTGRLDQYRDGVVATATSVSAGSLTLTLTGTCTLLINAQTTAEFQAVFGKSTPNLELSLLWPDQRTTGLG